jgi:hypothetical protein
MTSGLRLKATVYLLGALSLTMTVWGQAPAWNNRPNIIFFLVDYDKPETSVYGGNVLQYILRLQVAYTVMNR